MRGFISRYDKTKGFGFVTSEDGDDYFFHQGDMKRSVLAVEFEGEDAPKGLKAVNVRKRRDK